MTTESSIEAEVMHSMLGEHIAAVKLPECPRHPSFLTFFDQTKEVIPEEYKSSMRDLWMPCMRCNNYARMRFIDALLAVSECTRHFHYNMLELFKTPDERNYLETVFAARLKKGITIKDMFYDIPYFVSREFDPTPPHTARDCMFLLRKHTVNIPLLINMYRHDIPIPFNMIGVHGIDMSAAASSCKRHDVREYNFVLLPRWEERNPFLEQRLDTPYYVETE